MPIQLTKFLKANLEYCQDLAADTRDCVQLLFNRGGNRNLFIAKPVYGERLWVDGRLNIDDESRSSLERPIGLVLEGALEVTERFGCAPHERVRTTKILRPGDFFGLFEAIGGLCGQWEITSGVQRFLITNRLGNQRILGRSGWSWISNDQLDTLKHGKNASYDYSELVRFAIDEVRTRTTSEVDKDVAPWHATVLLFDRARISDNEALIILYKAAVDQLVSLARQNPPEALYENQPEIQESADEQRVAAALDAILSDDVPVFGLHHPGHCNYGPFDRIKASIEKLLAESNLSSSGTPPVHLWIPDYWSKIEQPGGLYVDALAGRFSMERATDLLVGKPTRKLRSGTRLEMLTRGDHWSVKVTTRDDKSAIFERLTVKRKDLCMAEDLHQELFPPGASEAAAYGWPRSLGDGFFLKAPST